MIDAFGRQRDAEFRSTHGFVILARLIPVRPADSTWRAGNPNNYGLPSSDKSQRRRATPRKSVEEQNSGPRKSSRVAGTPSWTSLRRSQPVLTGRDSDHLPLLTR